MDVMIDNSMQAASAALRENRVNDAINLLQGALSQTPDDFAANHMMGVALGKAGRGSESIARLLKATQLNPNHTAARTHLGMAYAAAGKSEMARQSFQAVLKIDPDFAPAQTALDRLPAPPPPLKPAPVLAAKPATVPAPVAAPAPPKADTKAKPAKAKKPAPEIDWAEWTLRILGAAFVIGGIYLRFFVTVENFRAYKWPGVICIIIGISMLKAGFSGPDDWKDDYR
jgi:tetratricopeptide (TPR) repeat protein